MMTKSDLIEPSLLVADLLGIKAGENFHLIYDTKGYFAIHHFIMPEEAKYKLCK